MDNNINENHFYLKEIRKGAHIDRLSGIQNLDNIVRHDID